MQSAKDSTYMALRERLPAVNADRVVVLEGVEQPAILVAENECANGTPAMADSFYLSFGAVRKVPKSGTSEEPLLGMECTVSYTTGGGSDDGSQRGRALGTLDTEVLGICSPPQAPRRDYTKVPPTDMGSNVFWTAPEFGEVQDKGGLLSRTAKFTVFFYHEVGA